MAAEFIAWSLARALGNYTPTIIGGGPNYSHVNKLQDVCASAQLPSASIGILYSGSAANNRKYEGCVINTWTLRVTDRGRITIDVTFFTNGSEATGASIAFPSTFASKNYYRGKDVTAKWDDFGGSLATENFLELEITINNNLARDEAKEDQLSTTGDLPLLEMGTREITVRKVVKGNELSQDYIDALAGTKKFEEYIILGKDLGNGDLASTTILLPEASWTLGSPSKAYRGTRRVMEIISRLHHNVAEDSPITVTTNTADVDYRV